MSNTRKNVREALDILENLGTGLHGPGYVGSRRFMNDEPYWVMEVPAAPLNRAMALLREALQ